MVDRPILYTFFENGFSFRILDGSGGSGGGSPVTLARTDITLANAAVTLATTTF